MENRQIFRELLVTTPGLGQYISGAILFEETLFQVGSARAGRPIGWCCCCCRPHPCACLAHVAQPASRWATTLLSSRVLLTLSRVPMGWSVLPVSTTDACAVLPRCSVQDTRKGTRMVEELNKQGIVAGIKVDKGLHPLANSNGESWCACLPVLPASAACPAAGACLPVPPWFVCCRSSGARPRPTACASHPSHPSMPLARCAGLDGLALRYSTE